MTADTDAGYTLDLTTMQAQVLECNKNNGWFESDRSVLEGHMLLITEVAEASEAYRDHGLKDATKVPEDHRYGDPVKPEGVGSEYADILIRLLDQVERDGVDLVYEFHRKMAYNRTRGYKHGGKRA